METDKKPSSKVILLVAIAGSFLFACALTAFAIGPDDREMALIEYGMLKQEIADNSTEWLELEAKQDALHSENSALRLELEQKEALLFPQNLSYSSQTGFPAAVDVQFTSYNPEVGQTDSTPCIAGGTGYNICEMSNAGVRTIALSQELVAWSVYGTNAPFEAGDHVWLVSKDQPDDSRCNGEFVVADAMNARYRNRGDLFFMDRSNNTSCHADIYIME